LSGGDSIIENNFLQLSPIVVNDNTGK